MNRISTYKLDLRKPRRYEYFYNPCKYIFFPSPRTGVYLSLSDGGYFFDVSKINEYFFPDCIEGFYISNDPQEGELYIICANCGIRFKDTYSYVELREIVEQINSNWKKLLGVSD